MKKLKIMIIIIILAIILIGIALFIVRINYKDVELQQEVEDTKTIESTVVEEIGSQKLYYNIDECIKRYFNYSMTKNEKAIKEMLKEGSTDISKDYITDDDVYIIKRIYTMDKISNVVCFVEVELSKNNIYLIVNLDYTNYTFEIIDSTKSEFESIANNKYNREYNLGYTIKENDYNTFSRTINDMNIIDMYYSNYKKLVFYKIDEAFNKLEPQYKLEKFNNDINKFKRYVQNNSDNIMDSNIVSYWIQENDRYVIKDSNDDYITIDIKNVIDYKIMLDNYTVETEELKQKYQDLPEVDKVSANLGKIFKWINTKEYSNIYSKLDNTFKNMYFKTPAEFESYISQKFFDKNIVGESNIEIQGNTYIATMNYHSNSSVEAQTGKQVIIMQLKPDNDFVISFQMN